MNKDFKANIILEKLLFFKFINQTDILSKKIKQVYNKQFLEFRIKKYIDNLEIRKLILRKKIKYTYYNIYLILK